MKSEIILYQPESSVRLEVRMEDETVWLTQQQIADLFDCSSDNVGLHLKNIFKEREFEKRSTTEEISVVRFEGKRQITRQLLHYNLDAILSVGYRVNSKNATQFRIWANKVLKDYLLKGYAINQRIERLEDKVFHLDRFLIIDEKEIFLIGASLKDLGKKWFAVAKLDEKNIEEIRKRLLN